MVRRRVPTTGPSSSTSARPRRRLARWRPRGDLAEGERLAAGAIVENTYLNSYVAHAAMETHSATARFEDGKVTVWASTQAPFQVKGAVMGALGLPADKVRIVSHYVGGGFGGKTEADQGVEAARLARIAGKPVQVVYSRQEEFFYDRFRPAASMAIRAGVANGKIVLWDAQIVGAGDREAFAVLRHPAPAHHVGGRMDGRQSSRHEPLRSGGVARAIGEQQHLRARIARRRAGRPGRRGPAASSVSAISPIRASGACWRRPPNSSAGSLRARPADAAWAWPAASTPTPAMRPSPKWP